jgi:hypothetical protein
VAGAGSLSMKKYARFDAKNWYDYARSTTTNIVNVKDFAQ